MMFMAVVVMMVVFLFLFVVFVFVGMVLYRTGSTKNVSEQRERDPPKQTNE